MTPVCQPGHLIDSIGRFFNNGLEICCVFLFFIEFPKKLGFKKNIKIISSQKVDSTLNTGGCERSKIRECVQEQWDNSECKNIYVMKLREYSDFQKLPKRQKYSKQLGVIIRVKYIHMFCKLI